MAWIETLRLKPSGRKKPCRFVGSEKFIDLKLPHASDTDKICLETWEKIAHNLAISEAPRTHKWRNLLLDIRIQKLFDLGPDDVCFVPGESVEQSLFFVEIAQGAARFLVNVQPVLHRFGLVIVALN